MKRILITILATAMLTAAPAQKVQKAATLPQKPKETAEDLMKAYRFTEAETMLTTEIAQLTRKKMPAAEQEAKLQSARMASRMMNATEKVTFIDSIVVPRTQIMRYIHLSNENGRISTAANFFGRRDTMDCTVYQSQMGDQIIYAQPDDSGILSLYASDKIGNDWTASHKLEGLDLGSDASQNYPFMLSDGATLYFASQGDESLGGYDIFMTRYDADTHSFLTPENIGMPFNSTANDYLYAIDEYNNLGWFVTDRNQPIDSVCVYTFIPNDTRIVYESIDSDSLRNYAMLHSISDTWTNEAEVKGAKWRLAESKRGSSTQSSSDFTFIVSDNIILHSIKDFQNSDAQQKAQWWVESTNDLNSTLSELATLRAQYADADNATRSNIKEQILSLEEQELKLRAAIINMEKNIRQLELGY